MAVSSSAKERRSGFVRSKPLGTSTTDVLAQTAEVHSRFEDSDVGGVRVERHRCPAADACGWSRLLQPGTAELCLNVEGSALLHTAEGVVPFGERTVALYALPVGARAVRLTGVRQAGAAHHFVIVTLAQPFLARRLAGVADHLLHPAVRTCLEPSPQGTVHPAVEVSPMSVSMLNVVRALADPPMSAQSGSRGLWYEAKVLETICLLLVAPTPIEPSSPLPPSARAGSGHRLQHRIEAVCAWLERDLLRPPSLKTLAAASGCSPFQLSRHFAAAVGESIPRYIRQLRLERAARLLLDEQISVTAAAHAVGYGNMSHFAKAFHAAFGCCPSRYALPASMPGRTFGRGGVQETARPSRAVTGRADCRRAAK